jgi:hypothetical protein
MIRRWTEEDIRTLEHMPSEPCTVTTTKYRSRLWPKGDPLFKHGLFKSNKFSLVLKGTSKPFPHGAQTMTIEIWNRLASE